VVGIPGRVVKKDNKRVYDEEQSPDLDQVDLPDPVNEALMRLTIRLLDLEKKVEELEAKHKA